MSPSTSPEHYQYGRDHQHRSFYPPALPPLPPLPSHMGGQALPPLPGPGDGFHQGFAANRHVPPPPDGASFANDDATTTAWPTRSDGDNDAWSSSHGNTRSPSNFADASPTPSRNRYRSGPYERRRGMIPPASARDNPSCGPRMPSARASWTGTPDDALLRERSSSSPPSFATYRGGPYFCEAPSLLVAGSGSSESSSASSTSAAAASGRPVPAKSAFMCFCEAKGAEISDRTEVSPVRPLCGFRYDDYRYTLTRKNIVYTGKGRLRRGCSRGMAKFATAEEGVLGGHCRE